MEPEIGPGSLLDEAAWRRDNRESMTAARNCRSGDAADGLATAASSAGAAGSTRQWRRQLTLLAKTDSVYSPNHWWLHSCAQPIGTSVCVFDSLLTSVSLSLAGYPKKRIGIQRPKYFIRYLMG
jgi:hypothetical protein